MFFAVDDRYVPYLSVALRSLIDNRSLKYDYRVCILIEDLSEKNRNHLEQMACENVSIEFVCVTERLRSICARLHLRDYYTKATYYRFFIPEMFPQYKRGLYLDCDIVLTADAAQLYRCPMGKNLVAAVNDEIISDIEVFAQYSEQVLGISRHEYFNAGILAMNLEEMRRVRIEEQFARLLGERAYSVAQDQDYLNKLCAGRVYHLSVRWNKTPIPGTEWRGRPKIAHFKINYKPWRYVGVLYEELFWQYAEHTPFYQQLLEERANYTEEERARDRGQYESLVALAEDEVEKAHAEQLTACKLALAEG